MEHITSIKGAFVPRVSADTEVLGEVVRALTDNLRTDELRPLLDKFNVTEIQPTEWYSLTYLLEIAAEIVRVRRAGDAMFDLVALGMASTKFISLPPDIDSIEKFLKVWESRQHYLYRGTDPGYMKVVHLADRHVEVHFRSPWPDDILYGTVYGNIRRVHRAGSTFKVYFDPTAPRGDKGAVETIVHIEWN